MADIKMSARGSASATATSVVIGADSPAVSELTTPSTNSTSQRQRQVLVERDQALVDDICVADLPDDPISPVKLPDVNPEEAERHCDNQIRFENGGPDNSDYEDESDLGLASNEAQKERAEHDDEIQRAVSREEAWADCVSSHHDEIASEQEHDRLLQETSSASGPVVVPGPPPGWVPPTAPTDWAPAKPKTAKKEPDVPFQDIDNPGNWSRCCFCPKFSGKGGTGDCVGHQLPTGATPVPVLANGKRSSDGCDFFHSGWQKEVPDMRSGATHNNMWPDSRKGCLDKNALSRIGLTPKRMQELDPQPDALFFHQLTLPIHNIDNRKVLTMPNDPRKSYCSNVACWTNSCACEELCILGGGCGHDFKPTSPAECLQWDGSVIMDGVLGRWQQRSFFTKV